MYELPFWVADTENSKMSEKKETEEQSTDNPGLDQNGVSVNRKAVCTVCGRLYRDPRILPCLHTFCSDCIGQLEPFSGTARPHRDTPEQGGGGGQQPAASVTVLCPECDSEVDIPPSGPAGLSTDHLALDEVFLETLVKDRPLGCDLCGEEGAESRCEVCCVSLCEFCCQAHRFCAFLFYDVLAQYSIVTSTVWNSLASSRDVYSVLFQFSILTGDVYSVLF